LYGAFVKSTVPLAIFENIDTSIALAIDGVVDVLTAIDIPGTNDVDIKHPGAEFLFTPISKVVECVGQPLGLVLANSQKAANAAALAVQATGLTFKDTGTPPILSLDEAIEKKKFFDLPKEVPYVINHGKNIDEALSASPHTYQGTVNFAGQRHFYMETQRSFVRPKEGGDSFELYTSTQDLDLTQQTVANLLNISQNKIVGKMTRAGGAFGGKLTRNLPCAMAATLAAAKHQKKIKVINERVDDLNMTGGREKGKAIYTVGFDNNGKILALKLDFYMDSGFSIDISDGDLQMAMYWADNVYNIPTWSSNGYLCKTNTPTNTAMRAPGVVHSIHTMEHVLHNISKILDIDPVQARALNFYAVGDTTPYNQVIERSTLLETWQQVQESSNYPQLKSEVDTFNLQNRWVKRGIHVAPVKYGMQHNGYNIHAIVNIFSDGSISLATGGLEIGQGLNTKVAQCCAFALNAPIDVIDVSVPNSTEKVAVSSSTGGSATSECACEATMLACEILSKRLEPYKSKYTTWKEIINAASNDNVLLSATAQYCPPTLTAKDHFRYFVWGSCVSIVELDVLTGETQILRSDIVYDCGVSLNPLVDLGQVEGAFCFGIGTFLTEEVVRDETNGQMLSNGTWDYKPPTSKCIPVEFNVAFLKGATDNPHGILSSKATGEPPYSLANSIYFALRYCIDEARKENKCTENEYDLDVPATQERILNAIGRKTSEFII
jgi:xanthine dehydrogenase/oxidase